MPFRQPVIVLIVCCATLLLSPREGHGVSEDPVVLQGQLIDPPEELIAAIRLPEGCRSLTPIARDRISSHLEVLGYKIVRIQCRGSGVQIELRPHRIIRKIYIKGNWPLFEEEILRRLRFRPGQRLPEGKELSQAIARQEDRMNKYLSREGYFDGSLRIKITPTSTPYQVNLEIRIVKGRRYKVGEVIAEVGRVHHGTGAEKDGKKAIGPAIEQDEIADLFRHKIWFYKRSFNTRQFNKDAEELVRRFHEKGHPGVRIKKSFEVVRERPPEEAVRIRLAIQQRKKIVVSYQGNQNIKDKDLDEVLTIFTEGAYDDFELAQSARQIHRLYQSKGYLQARVQFSRKVGRAVDRVTFQIHEGPRFRIEEIQFAGNASIKDDDLRKVIKTRPFPFLGSIGLGEGGHITDTQLRQDVDRLETLYREQGFPEVKVTGEITPHPALMGRPGALAALVGSAREAADGPLFVRFTISEGRRAVVETVHITGNRVFGAEFLLEQLSLKRGHPFTAKALQLDKARLARIYGEKGYPYAEVRSLEEVSLNGTRVTIQFTVKENRPVRFGPVFIRGNFKTRRGVILNDLDFKRGDLFDIRRIEQSESRLRRRQIFNVARVQLLGISTQQEEVPVLVQVEERYDDHGAIEFGMGGSTDNLVFGSLAYTNQNLLGFGTSFSLKGEVGMRIQSGNIHYRDPRIFGSTVAWDTQGFIRNQITERLGEVLTFGLSTSLSKELLSRLNGLLRYEIRRVKHKDDLNRPAGVDQLRQVDVFTRTAGIGPALIYDRRDNPLSPTEGFRVQGSMLWATRYMGGTDDFLKFNLSGQAFIPLPRDITIALSVRYDHAVPLAGTVQLPKVERYYAGGDTTIRGFDQDMAWTEVIRSTVPPLNGVTLNHVRPQGGMIRLLTNVEFQFPIWKESILLGLPLMGAIFFDNGFVTNSFYGFEWDRFRHAVGLALRIVTPVGFFSIEPAFPLDPALGDDHWRLHFNFGFVF